MSKLAIINQYRYAPAAGGGLFGGVISAVGKFIGKGLGIIKSGAPKVVETAVKVAKDPRAQAALAAGAAYMAGQAIWPGGAKAPSGASGAWGCRRRRRGITATELRGYRKVANLLHKEGMVSRRARGRK